LCGSNIEVYWQAIICKLSFFGKNYLDAPPLRHTGPKPAQYTDEWPQ
jgi:hypothetical protein